MFERYTEKARRVIFFARFEASQFGSPYIETEHLLLGLLREDKAMASRLLPPDASMESIRKQVESRTPLGKFVSTSVDLPISNECKRVLAYAAEEAERLAHKHIGTEHLLLGLLREEKSFAAEMLRERGLTLATAREKIAAGGDPGEQGAPPERGERPRELLQRMLDEYGECFLEFIDISGGVRVGLCRWLLRPTVPRIGEEVILGSRSFRVRDVIYVFQGVPPEPEEIIEVQKRIKFIVHRMENATANNEFEKARFYADEERKERDKLRALREKHQPDNSATGAEPQRLTEIVVKVEPTGEPSGKPTAV